MKKIDLNKEAPSEYAFRIYKGEKILSLRQLRDALETMEDPVFAHHVNEQRNDFATWIKDILGYSELSDKMRSLKGRYDILGLLKEEKPKAPEKLLPPQLIIPERLPAQKKEFGSDKTLQKIEEILQREKAIGKKEENIRRIEEDIVKKINAIKKSDSGKFFTREFIQGLVVGFLFAVFLFLVYLRFFT